ncbi:MAG: SusC/RagA family TonB-linked outer membrane protein [Cytophagales bacterium]|nr:SusC/RagA family TonB-linked outer membrane protein [Cytophagales bacterium]
MKNNLLRQLIMMSKFTTYGVFLQCLFIGVLLASDISAQQVRTVNEVTVQLYGNELTINEAFRQIEASTDFQFSYYPKDFDANQKINLKKKAQKVGDILLHISREANLSFKQINNNINVRVRKNIDKKEIVEVIIQGITITGTVTASENNEGLPGVNVIVKGTSQGTVTDVEGNYSLEVPGEASVLVFSSVGYLQEEAQVGTQTIIDISMVQDITSLDEIVVVGYGTQKKINLTGAVDVVTEDQIASRPVSNLSEALQGASPNLNLTSTGWDGEPGGEMNVDIRGLGSLTGNSSPYILIDGVPMDMNQINPADIESISVLKDAAASAIYGARAPYGVILITTKKGKMDEKVSVNYSNNISFSSPLGLPHMANSLIYVTAHDQASINAGLAANFTDENYDRIRQYMAGEITEETWLLPDGSDWAGNGIWSIAGNGDNDWMYIYYDDMVMRQKHDLSVRGGGKNNSYFISAGFWDQPGELAIGDQFYKRYNLTSNLQTRATKWLTVDFNTKFIREHNQYFNTRQGWNRSTMYHNFARTNAFRPKVLPNGEYSNISYIPMLNGGKENEWTNTYLLSLRASFEPVKDWVTTISYNYRNITTRNDDNEETVYGSKPNGDQYVIAYPISSFATTFQDGLYQMFNAVSSYGKSFGSHDFNVMVGYEQELLQRNDLWGKKNEILTRNVPSISTSTGEFFLDDTKSHWGTQGFFGRFNYNYNEKYLVEINARYDGSSRFSKDSRWGFFPSFSLGYNIAQEDFWTALEPYVDNLKFRFSYGSLGNQNVGNYLYLSTLGIRTDLGWIIGEERPNYTIAPDLVSDQLTWETSTTTNFGMDASFLESRLGVTFDVYTRITSEMFGPAEALPRTLGTDVPPTNNATLKTNGFELVLTWQDELGDNFTYNVRGILADNVSEVTEYNNPTKTLSTWYEGARTGEIWGLQTAGIYQSDDEAEAGPDQTLFYPIWGAGDIHYRDIDGDNVITRGTWTADDSGDYSIIGNNSPRFTYGLSAGASWKGFDFSMFWQGVAKRDYAFNSGDMMFYGFNGHQWWGMNVWEETVDYWRPANETNALGPNVDAYYPKPYLSKQDYKNKEIQTRYMQNAAYLRLKNLTFGYTLPPEISSKIRLSNARIFVSGENLLTFTKLTKQFDPEALSNIGWGVGKVHPLRRVYAVGLSLTF